MRWPSVESMEWRIRHHRDAIHRLNGQYEIITKYRKCGDSERALLGDLAHEIRLHEIEIQRVKGELS